MTVVTDLRTLRNMPKGYAPSTTDISDISDMSEARNRRGTRRLVTSPICCYEQPSQSVFLVFEDVEMRLSCS